MASIPLLCKICPKQPDFSDISHLLTHVASKGHLAQELKAKVRSRQDASIREKLDAYGRWYEKHQIEKLLSQRLILKESKDATTTSRAKRALNSPSAGSVQNMKPRRRRAKPSDKVPEASPVKPEEPLIDPQLSWYPPSSPSPFLDLSGHGSLQQHEKAFNHRYHVPRMCEEQDICTNRPPAMVFTPSKIPSGQKRLHDPGPDMDMDTDYFNTFIRSPTVTAYPDPSELPGLSFGFSPLRTTQRAGECANQTPEPSGRITERAEGIQPPVLKGVKWPGMSIFDSASLEAQRLRNQKKDGSILEQMEQNSIVVEQTERIYWPDGSLKQERLITGNVESSPLKEPTPPPKRQRAKAKKAVLKDTSTNAPKPTHRASKTQGQLRDSRASDLRNISKKALATLDPLPSEFIYPRNTHMGYHAANDEELERRLTSGRFSHGRRQAFDVFNDNVATGALESAMPRKGQEKPSAKAAELPFLNNTHGHHGGSPQSQAASFPALRTSFAHLKPSSRDQNHDPPNGLPWDGQHWSFTNHSKSLTAEEDSENIEPILDGDGRIDDEAFQAHPRITQRYFSVTGNQPPQFFNSLPPHMDFGGLAEARYYGSTLNVLNPYLRHHPPPQYGPAQFHQSVPSFFASRQDDIGKSEQPALAKDGVTNEAKGL